MESNRHAQGILELMRGCAHVSKKGANKVNTSGVTLKSCWWGDGWGEAGKNQSAVYRAYQDVRDAARLMNTWVGAIRRQGEENWPFYLCQRK